MNTITWAALWRAESQVRATLCLLTLALPSCAGVGVNRPAAVGAAGGTAPPSPSTSFIEADVDGDARISPSEYNAHFARDGAQHESFQAADTNRDGVLTFDEWQALGGPSRAPAVVPPARR